MPPRRDGGLMLTAIGCIGLLLAIAGTVIALRNGVPQDETPTALTSMAPPPQAGGTPPVPITATPTPAGSIPLTIATSSPSAPVLGTRPAVAAATPAPAAAAAPAAIPAPEATPGGGGDAVEAGPRQ